MTDRWALEWPEDAPPSPDGLGDHAAARYRHLRRCVEQLDEDAIDHALFGLLLSAESMRDEMRAYEQQTSELLRLAQTGHFVRQLQRLHGVLDAANSEYAVDEPASLKEWGAALDQERGARVARYEALLASLGEDVKSGDSGHENDKMALLREIESEEQQEEVLTLLKAAIDKYGDDVLTSDEVETTKKAFDLVARHANTVAISLPSWVVPPFEFSGTFSLSRWGNDLFVPEHSDKTRFIIEATTWSELNHPHVAKFLGAFHVGDRPFIAHEKVRTLSEYVSEAKNRQRVWQSLCEVALALQYLHERGLACSQLELASVYCAEFAAKAMLLGVGLVNFGDSALQASDPHDERETGRSSPVATDIEALGALILDCFREMGAGEEDNDSDEEEEEEEEDPSRSMPAVCPKYLEEEEWEALLDIRKVDAASSGAILQVIERLKALAGVAGQQDWFDEGGVFGNEISTDDGAIDVGAMVVPAIGKSVAEILSRCAEIAGPQDPEAHIQSRLADIYSQLMAMDLHQADVASHKELVAHFATLLVRLHRLLEQKTGIDASSRASSQERVPVSMFSFHSDIDRLLESHNLDISSAVHSWKPKWELLSSRHQFVALSTLIRHSSPQLPIVREEYEAKALSLDQVGSKALAALRSGKKLMSNLQQRIGDTEAGEWRRGKLPRWFLPPTEVDFKSFTEFSRGAFGSVHLGKWFDTRVVVKRVFTDADDRETVQAQFRREADVWFKLNHINIVKMYGACHLDQPFFVCEYASKGDLDSYLERKDRDPRLMWYSLLNAALGLQYLHDNGIVHADLKADNILVGADGVPKLADFGLSVSARRSDADEIGGAVGAYRWKAPECLPSRGVAGKAATFASDVYSFAMVMIEIVSGNYPWGGSMPDAAVAFHVKKGRLPPRPQGMEDSEWRLIQRMCCLDPTQRVTIDAVVIHLSSLVGSLDMAELWPTIDADELVVPHKNRVVARGGALLSLIELAKSKNERLAWFATEYLLTVHIHRGLPAEQREIDALVHMLKCGSDNEKAWSADAMRHLSWTSDQNQVSFAAAGAIPLLVALVSDGNDTQKENAAAALDHISENDENKVLVASAGGIPPLLALLRDGNDEQKEFALATLWKLAGDENNRVLIASAGGIPVLIDLARDGNDEQKEDAVGVLNYLSENDENKELIASAGGIPVLVALARDSSDGERLNETAALWNLAENEDNRELIASAGGIPVLITLASDGTDNQRHNAAGALRKLSENDDNKVLIASAGGIPVLIDLARDGSDDQKEYAVGTLVNISEYGDNKALIASAGGIPILVEMVRDGNDDQKENALGTLVNLSPHSDNKELIASAGSIPLLVALVCDGDDEQKDSAAIVLWNLAYKNASIAAQIVLEGGTDALIGLLMDGNDDQKCSAAGALGFLDLDQENKSLVTENGGVAALLAFIHDADDDNDKEEGLVALRSICCDGGDAICASLAAADGAAILSQVVQSGNKRLGELASAILSDTTSKNVADGYHESGRDKGE